MRKGRKIRQLLDQSIIWGTVRPEDLIPCFLDTLRYLNHRGLRQYRKIDFDSEYIGEVIEELMDKLNEHAPKGYYFGAHPGDGSDFGFWSCPEEE
jgi:hypothetical protein